MAAEIRYSSLPPPADCRPPLDRISVRGLVLDCRVGAFEEEKHATQRVRFTVEISVLPSRHAGGDEVRHILSYDLIVDAIRKIVSQGHINLLETLAERIAHRCLSKRRAAKVRVLVEKLDRLDGTASLAVEIERHQGARNGKRIAVQRATMQAGAPARQEAGMGEKSYNAEQIEARLRQELPQWQYADGVIQRRFGTHGWKSSLMVANTIGHLAEAAWHHPDLTVSYGSVEVRLTTHSADGITDKDFELARKIEDVIGWQPAKEGGALDGTPNSDKRFAYLKYDG